MLRSSWLAAASLAAACSSPSSSSAADVFPSTAYVTTPSDSGQLVVEVRTAPSQPPPRGTCDVELRVTDGKGQAVDGLAVSVQPWMPSMGHGASVTPQVAPKGDGRYLASDVSLYMPGSWQLRVSIHGAHEDHAEPTIQVP